MRPRQHMPYLLDNEEGEHDAGEVGSAGEQGQKTLDALKKKQPTKKAPTLKGSPSRHSRRRMSTTMPLWSSTMRKWQLRR